MQKGSLSFNKPNNAKKFARIEKISEQRKLWHRLLDTFSICTLMSNWENSIISHVHSLCKQFEPCLINVSTISPILWTFDWTTNCQVLDCCIFLLNYRNYTKNDDTASNILLDASLGNAELLWLRNSTWGINF
jgi:hypothetical protein